MRALSHGLLVGTTCLEQVTQSLCTRSHNHRAAHGQGSCELLRHRTKGTARTFTAGSALLRALPSPAPTVNIHALRVHVVVAAYEAWCEAVHGSRSGARLGRAIGAGLVSSAHRAHVSAA